MASCVCRCREFGSVDGSLIVMSEWSNHSVVNRRVPIVSARRGSDIALLVGDAGSVTDNLLRPSPTPTLSSCTIAAERGLLPRRVKSRPCERNQTKLESTYRLFLSGAQSDSVGRVGKSVSVSEAEAWRSPVSRARPGSETVGAFPIKK